MNESNSLVNAIERIYGSDLKVYGVEKGRKEERSYSRMTKTASLRNKSEAEAFLGQEAQGNLGQTKKRTNGKGILLEQILWAQEDSLERRQEKIEFQKNRIPGSERVQRAIASYEENFLIY